MGSSQTLPTPPLQRMLLIDKSPEVEDFTVCLLDVDDGDVVADDVSRFVIVMDVGIIFHISS